MADFIDIVAIAAALVAWGFLNYEWVMVSLDPRRQPPEERNSKLHRNTKWTGLILLALVALLWITGRF